MKRFEALRDQNGKYGVWDNKTNSYKIIGAWLSSIAPSYQECLSQTRRLN